MIDFLKANTENQTYINRLFLYAENYLQPHKPQNNNYKCFSNGSGRFRFEFRKVYENKNLIGFRNVEICFSPHYLFNNDLHNGNDLTPLDAIKTIKEAFSKIGITENEMIDFKVVNIEFGLNIIPETDIKNLINGILFYKKTPFIIPNTEQPYFKKSDATNYKHLKAYAKGLQFPQYGINPNTFRFEVKSKQAKNIKRYGIYTTTDLLNLKTYNRLGQTLLNEWENVLITNLEHDLKDLKPDEVQFVQSVKTIDFWIDLIEQKHRNTFQINKEKYYKIVGTKNNLRHLIKLQIIDKLFSFSKCAYSTQRTPTNTEKPDSIKYVPNRINLEYAHFERNIKVKIHQHRRRKHQRHRRQCKVTRLDISMQKKGSKFLCFTGLKWYKETAPETYEKLCTEYLTEKNKTETIDRQLYYIAHNIRNKKTNPNHNPKYSRKRFEQRNYHPNQLQFNY